MRVVISGGGIAGLALAIGVRRAGIETEVLEQHEGPDRTGAGLTLWPNAFVALDALGVGEAVREIGLTAPEARVLTPAGRVLSRVTADETRAVLGGAPLCVHRVELAGVLHAAAGEVEFGRRMGPDEDIDADLLVGADGVTSAVVARLEPGLTPTYADYTAWRGVATVDAAMHDGLAASETWGRGERFGIVPMTDSRVYWFATANTPEGERAGAGEWRAVLDRFGAWHAPIAAVLESTDPDAVLRNDVYDRRPLRRWSDGRAVVIGDAAHPMQPNLGQGACQALEDAAALAAILTEGPANIPAALQRFEAHRRPTAERVVARARRLGQLAQASNPVSAAARNTLARVTPAKATLRSLRSFGAAR